ncbi:unnamed protein product [Notodromas monacha]|uniref:protein-tyrosine-phosphatase n=1 Tax=Notodromas monacha TaxID=399045 RepID=A0A7R9BDA2_9CRUS|nr:unnamed protein product [Notodromas monacha]CAG0913250.1 unnamed protein product [Notodromas monacha]
MPLVLPYIQTVVSFCRSAGGLIPAASWMYQQLVRLISRLMNMTEQASSDQPPDEATADATANRLSTSCLTIPPQIGFDAETLSRLTAEFKEIDGANRWDEVYSKIMEESVNPLLFSKEARKPRNRILNRYKNVNPYDHSRVVLSDFEVDYVNANLVEVPSVGRRYILSQGPLEITSSHFWLMIWQQKSKGIIMLNGLFEKKVPKCFQYWPDKVGTTLTFNDVQIMVKLDEEVSGSVFTTRKFSVTKTSDSAVLPPGRIITQFHYTTWPDFGAPKTPAEFLDFLVAVRESGVLSPDVGPAIVHCSAGIGRSGTFCLVDAFLLELGAGRQKVSIRECLLAMRQFRMGLVQTSEQYRFAFLAILHGAKDERLVPCRGSAGSENGTIVTVLDGPVEREENSEGAEPVATDGDTQVEDIFDSSKVMNGGVNEKNESDVEPDKNDLKRHAVHAESESESPVKHPKTDDHVEVIE